MNCSTTREQIGIYLDGELPEHLAAKVEEHVKHCEACAAELEGSRQLISQFTVDSVGDIRVPADLWNRIEQKLNARTRPQVVLFRFFRKPLAMAASLAFLLGAGAFVAVWVNSSSQVAQAETVDYRVLLDGLAKDADAAVDRFLKHYKATPMDVSTVMTEAAPLHFSIPHELPGGYTLEQSYQLQFGPNKGYAAKYRRGSEPVFVCFHTPMSKTLLGVHRDSQCALAKGSHCVEVGPWQLIHFTDPITCHCLLSRSTNENELRQMLAAISPSFPTDTSPAR